MTEHSPAQPVKLSDLKPGDVIIADDSFTCLLPGYHEVQADRSREGSAALFIACSEGRHFLDGQEDEDGNLAGLSR